MSKELYSFDIERLMMKSHEMLIHELIKIDREDSFSYLVYLKAFP
jgi:hypothetical protein